MTWRKWLTAAAAAATALIAVVAAVQSASLEDRGRELFFADGCYGCHTIGKMGTPIGPDLSHIGTKYSRGYLERWLRDPNRPAAGGAHAESRADAGGGQSARGVPGDQELSMVQAIHDQWLITAAMVALTAIVLWLVVSSVIRRR